MLEEFVAKEKHPPAETALAMLSFLQELPAGGTAAEKRFISLYGPLCDRIFGKILGEKEEYRHKDGGWFSAQHAWPRTTSSGVAPVSSSRHQPLGQTGRLSSLSMHTKQLQEDPVVRLLGSVGKTKQGELPPPTLIEAISRESENRPEVYYKFPFFGLPKQTQELWLASLEPALGGQPTRVDPTENSLRLFRNLLRQGPQEQAELQLYRQKTLHKHHEQLPGIRLSPRGFHSPSPRKLSPSKETAGGDASPVVMFSMLEYYHFLFLRYPLAAPAPKTLVQRRSPRAEHYGDKIYLDIYKCTLRRFLPYEPEEGRHIAFDQTSRQSELFLRVIIALWIETQCVMDQTNKVVEAIQERKRYSGVTEPLVFDLSSTYELVQTRYDPPVSQVQRCLRLLIVRVVVDPALSKAIDNRRGWCLGPAMTALQQPFYNQVRATFRHASIHASSSPFFAAFSCWLIWLEPWNAFIRE